MKNYNDFTAHEKERKGQWVFPQQTIDSGNWLEDQLNQLDKIKHIPAMIIWGMKDYGYVRQEYNRWHTLLPGSTLVKVWDASHYPHLDAPRKVTACIEELIKEHPIEP